MQLAALPGASAAPELVASDEFVQVRTLRLKSPTLGTVVVVQFVTTQARGVDHVDVRYDLPQGYQVWPARGTRGPASSSSALT